MINRERKEGAVAVGFLDGGHWSACFGLSYRDLCLYDAASSQRVVRENGNELRNLAGSGTIPQARNRVARVFLESTDAEWLWFVDTDMGFAPDTVDRLVKSADPALRPVVGGLAFACLRQPGGPFYGERFVIQPTLYAYVDKGDEVGFQSIRDYPRDQVVQVGGTGSACILIHWTVLDQMLDRFGPSWYDPIVHPSGLKGQPRTFSEDLSFCVRLAAMDIPLHVDTSVQTTHEKGAIYLDQEMYDLSRSMELGVDHGVR